MNAKRRAWLRHVSELKPGMFQMKPKRPIRQRTAAEIREAAARLVERIAKLTPSSHVAERIRRLPLAVRFKAK